MLTLPVHLGSTLQGLARSDGILELHEDALVLRLQSRDAFLEVVKSRIRSISIPLEKVEAVRWKTGLFGSRLEIRITDLEILSKIPNADTGTARLHVARRYRQDAAEIQSLCSLAIADSRLRKISDLMVRDDPTP